MDINRNNNINKNTDIGKEILKSIQIIIEQKLNALPADQTYASVIKKANTDNTYVILDRTGNERTVKCSIPGARLQVMQRVWVKEPCGDLKHIHICGVC